MSEMKHVFPRDHISVLFTLVAMHLRSTSKNGWCNHCWSLVGGKPNPHFLTIWDERPTWKDLRYKDIFQNSNESVNKLVCCPPDKPSLKNFVNEETSSLKIFLYKGSSCQLSCIISLLACVLNIPRSP
jgi:hypothetical protein